MVNSNFTPQDKKPGDLILSADWNAAMGEIKRLEKAKVNREGADTLKGPLTIQDALNVTGDIKISGSRLKSADGFGIIETNNKEWLRINPDENYPAIALYKPVAITTGGLAIGELGQLPQGVLKVTQSVYLATAGGNVGIGTTSPDFHLQVGSKDTVGTWKLGVSGKGKIGNYRQWTLRTGDGENSTEIHKLRIRDEQAKSDRVTIDENGNVIFTGTVAAAAFIGIGAFVVGMILMWSGSESNVPSGWALCDGTNGTPDLRGRFVLSSGQGTGLTRRTFNERGGVERHTLILSEMPIHNHNVNDPGHSHNWTASRQQAGTDDNNNTSELSKGDAGTPDTISKNTDSRTTNITIQNQGGNQPHENMPPFYVLAYLMKI